MNDRFDIAIVGGGPVGWACALAAKQAAIALKQTLSVAIIDPTAPRASPSGMIETRVYTVTDQNVQALTAAGVEFDDTRTTDVDTIRVFEQTGVNALTFTARDAHRARLAMLIEHDALTAAIAKRAQSLGVTWIQSDVKAIGTLDDHRYLELANGALLHTKLAVVAQGAASPLREALGVSTIKKDYDRVGAVAHFKTDAPHRGEARQWFLPDRSVLALLPLPDIDGAPAVSMVWSATNERAAQLQSLSPAALCETVSSATQSHVTVLDAHTSVHQFPLRLIRVANPVVERAVLVGDAAHAIHPLAGQGVNLGLADACALQATLQEALRVNFDVGHALLLAKFRRSRYSAILAMQAATDGLARLYNLNESFFATSPQTLAAVGNLGMRVLGRVPAFRRVASSTAS